jgi:UDP-glucose:(heptosyl)LPS alpha-1,3-glucosyltransferase
MSDTRKVGERRLRIAVFNRIFSKQAGGAERYSVALVEELAAKHEFHVFAQEINHAWPGITYHRVSAPLRRFRWLNQLWYATATWWATRTGFDIVHSHENTWHGHVQTVHVLPVKHNLFNGKTGWKRLSACLKVVTSPRLMAYLALEKGRFADQKSHNPREIIVTSPSLLNIFHHTYPNHKNTISIVTPGVAKADLDVDKQAIRKELVIPNNCFAIAFIGNRYDIKGLPTLLLAMQPLPDNVHLIVVGNNDDISRFQQQAKDLNLNTSSNERVHFFGAINDVSKVYQAADCLAHPTLEDTFAMVVLEAMSYGLPVIVSQEKYCGIAGLLTDQVNALILQNPKDALILTQQLQGILDDAVLREKLSAESIKFADNYSWVRIAQEQEQIYFKIANLAH